MAIAMSRGGQESGEKSGKERQGSFTAGHLQLGIH